MCFFLFPQQTKHSLLNKKMNGDPTKPGEPLGLQPNQRRGAPTCKPAPSRRPCSSWKTSLAPTRGSKLGGEICEARLKVNHFWWCHSENPLSYIRRQKVQVLTSLGRMAPEKPPLRGSPGRPASQFSAHAREKCRGCLWATKNSLAQRTQK